MVDKKRESDVIQIPIVGKYPERAVHHRTLHLSSLPFSFTSQRREIGPVTTTNRTVREIKQGDIIDDSFEKGKLQKQNISRSCTACTGCVRAEISHKKFRFCCEYCKEHYHGNLSSSPAHCRMNVTSNRYTLLNIAYMAASMRAAHSGSPGTCLTLSSIQTATRMIVCCVGKCQTNGAALSGYVPQRWPSS